MALSDKHNLNSTLGILRVIGLTTNNAPVGVPHFGPVHGDVIFQQHMPRMQFLCNEALQQVQVLHHYLYRYKQATTLILGYWI